MSRTLRMVLALACIVVITLCAGMLTSRLAGGARLADLTENDLYTLSQGTKNILAKLNQPITLKLYYARTAALKGTDVIQDYNSYYQYVRDLLREYVRRSDGKLTLEVIDPRPYSDEEQEAMRQGLERIPITEDEGFFFGLAASSELGETQEIAFFEPDRQRLVEYDVSKLLSDLMQREKRTVGVISSLPITGPDMSPYMMQMMQMQGRRIPRPWAMIGQLRLTYEVRRVEAEDGRLPEDVEFLLVVHPKDLDEQTLFAIDQYVMNGGQLLVFVDPFCAMDRRQQQTPYGPQQQESSSQLNELLDSWGVRTEADEVATDPSLAVPIQLQRGRPQDLPTYMELTGDCASDEEIVTAEIDSVRMLFAGALHRTGAEGVEVRTLLQTTDAGGIWQPDSPFAFRAPDPERILRQSTKAGRPLLLGCMLTGGFKTNFPDGLDIETEADEDEPPADTQPAETQPAETQPATKTRHLEARMQAAEAARVLVFADADMLSDMLAYRPTFLGMKQVGGNTPLVLNALDFLAGSEDLISIRTRGKFARPFDKVRQIEHQAEEATAEEIERIEGDIQRYQRELDDLGRQAEGQDPTLLRSEVLAKRRELNRKIREANTRLRRVKAAELQSVEDLGDRLRTLNMLGAPALILLIAVVLAVARYARARHYASRRS